MYYKGNFLKIFGKLNDFRKYGKVRYEVLDVLFLVVSAFICGSNTWKGIHGMGNPSYEY